MAHQAQTSMCEGHEMLEILHAVRVIDSRPAAGADVIEVEPIEGDQQGLLGVDDDTIANLRADQVTGSTPLGL